MAELNAVIGVRGLPGLPPTVCISLLTLYLNQSVFAHLCVLLFFKNLFKNLIPSSEKYSRARVAERERAQPVILVTSFSLNVSKKRSTGFVFHS